MSGRHKNKNSRRARAPAQPAVLGSPSGNFTPDHDDGDGTQDEAGSDSELREAGPREATSSPQRFSQNKVELLEEEIKMLQGRLTTARFESRGASDGIKRSSWKAHSIQSLPSDTPPID